MKTRKNRSIPVYLVGNTYPSLYIQPNGIAHSHSGNQEHEHDELHGVRVELEASRGWIQNAPDELSLRCAETCPYHFRQYLSK